MTSPVQKREKNDSVPATHDIHSGTAKEISYSHNEDDDAILQANGHSQVMARQFNWISALGLGFSITNSWIGYLSCFGQTLIYGGAQACIFTLIVAFIVQFIPTLGLAELASAFPSSGGQYHFCYILSPDRTRRYFAYTVGWLSVLAWWVATCSGISVTTSALNGIVHFFIPGYVASQWETFLTYVGVAIVTMIPIFLVPKRMSYVTQFTLCLSLSAYLVFFVVSLAMHQQTRSATWVVKSGQGISGWNEGTAWMLAVGNSMYSFGAVDGAMHISEEMSQAGRRVPQVMIMSLILGLVTCLSLFIALTFFISDLDAVRDSPLPSLELIYQITGSRKTTLGLFILFLMTCMSALPSQWVTSGRMAWAFARDNGTPFPEIFSHVSEKFQFPVYATVAAFSFICVYGLLYLASTTAFNTIITSAVLFLNITYAVPQGILLLRGREALPKRYLNLGRVGYPCNVFSVLWTTALVVLICLPPKIPVTLQSMNYICVVLAGVFLVINGLWLFIGRERFEGPHIDWSLLGM
ncbi:amino acid/polyamine transporter I [Aspergillus ambiguus]|uniref:putative GABA permease n=1 Tax=Aspergillus ambiguus TaxID=176160 RepID=UPI003CCE0964